MAPPQRRVREEGGGHGPKLVNSGRYYRCCVPCGASKSERVHRDIQVCGARRSACWTSLLHAPRSCPTNFTLTRTHTRAQAARNLKTLTRYCVAGLPRPEHFKPVSAMMLVEGWRHSVTGGHHHSSSPSLIITASPPPHAEEPPTGAAAGGGGRVTSSSEIGSWLSWRLPTPLCYYSSVKTVL
jgi:hypothetical protein